MAERDRWLRLGRWFLLAALVIALLPMIRVAFYNHISTDDFSYGVLTRDAWMETGSLLAVVQKALEQTAVTYQDWQGSYASLFLFALQPGIFGEAWYRVSFFILMGTWLLAVFSSVLRLWRAYLPEENQDLPWILAALYCLTTIELMPFPVEAFYWWNGSIYYFFFHSLALILMANLLLMAKPRKRGEHLAGLTIGSLLLAAAVGGSNYVSALTTLEFGALLTGYLLLRRHPARWRTLTVTITGLASLAVNALAPGNAVRQAVSPKSSVIWAIAHSFEEGWNHALEWTGLPFVLFLIVSAAFLGLIPTEKLFHRGWMLPGLTALSLLIYVSSFTPALYAISWKGPGRARNLCFLFWTASCFMGALSLADSAKRLRRRKANRARRAVPGLRPKYILALTALCLLLLGGDAVVRFKAGDRTRYASVSALHALLSGEAEAYDAVMWDRVELLGGNDPNPALQDFTMEVPAILFFDDLTDDPGDWRNRNMAAYYHKQTVVKARPTND